MGIATTVRSFGIEQVNADPSPTGHQTSQAMHQEKVTLMIGTTIQGIVVTIVKNMDMFLKIA